MTRDRRNSEALRFHVPAPSARPGDPAAFAHITIPPAGTVHRPAIDVAPESIRDLAFDLIRVLDDEGNAVGPWATGIDVDRLLHGLRAMILTRAYDERMVRVQRQGKSSFYMKSTGEEAVACAAALALDHDDMCFPTYRQQGLLVARDWPIRDLMCQVLSNAGDRLKGRQMPVFYSTKAGGFFSISGNLGTQYIQAVGWALASAYQGDTRIAAAWIGEGATAEADFHHALTFATVYRAPVILNVVNNQWAISSFSGFAGGEQTTFAARAIGYGLPALRVDGNDFLAVHAATEWAAQRARANHGPTLIEMYTYRADAHSTSDDPGRYRPSDEARCWPLGDPVARLKRHLVALGAWDDDRHAALTAEMELLVRDTLREAESLGSLNAPSGLSPGSMFEDVFETMPWHLKAQRAQAGY